MIDHPSPMPRLSRSNLERINADPHGFSHEVAKKVANYGDFLIERT